MKVVVLIPNHKPELKEEVFNALNNQDYKDYEVIINYKEPIYFERYEEDSGKNRSLNISLNRMELKRKALETDADWFLWVDSDIILPNNAISKLMENKRDIIGGWYKAQTGKSYTCGNMNYDLIGNHLFEIQEGIKEVDWIGFGCVLMSRKALEKLNITNEVVDRNIKDVFGNEYFMGDSVFMSLQMKDNGFNIFVNGDVLCEHMGINNE